MAWEIQWDGYSVEYTVGEDSYEIDNLQLESRECHEEESSGYQEPKDRVMIDKYVAHTEHGVFRWQVSAVSEGFSTGADISDVFCISEPQECDANNPNFIIA